MKLNKKVTFNNKIDYVKYEKSNNSLRKPRPLLNPFISNDDKYQTLTNRCIQVKEVLFNTAALAFIIIPILAGLYLLSVLDEASTLDEALTILGLK